MCPHTSSQFMVSPLADISRPCMQLHTIVQVGIMSICFVKFISKKYRHLFKKLRDKKKDKTKTKFTYLNYFHLLLEFRRQMVDVLPRRCVLNFPQRVQGTTFESTIADVASAAEQVNKQENRLHESGVRRDDRKGFYRGKQKGDDGIPRFALFSIWRPLETVHRDPLTLSSCCASFPESEYGPAGQIEPMDHLIHAHLSRIIDTNAPNLNVANEQQVRDVSFHEDNGTYQSHGYLAYGPRDEEQKAYELALHFRATNF
ncbi:hypothetical protein N7499_010986 [Penicillium canescens]|nr:hypothetical protein N7499_010986 [Penicillium canescens]